MIRISRQTTRYAFLGSSIYSMCSTRPSFSANSALCSVRIYHWSLQEIVEKFQNGADGKLIDTSFLHGFLASISVIIVSELGDKTFFIAAIMAMKHSR